jgi:hypothetical protein
LHDTHGPVQAILQHTPSTQKVDAQSLADLHWAPFLLMPQRWSMHFCPSAHAASLSHALAQRCVPGSQAYGVHMIEIDCEQAPLPSQVITSATRSRSHWPALHSVPRR